MRLPGVFLLSVFACVLPLGASRAADINSARRDLDLPLRTLAERTPACELATRKADGLCKKVVIQLGPTADGFARQLLRTHANVEFELLDDRANPDVLRPVLIGPKELDKANYIVLLQQAFAAGHTVGITDASPDDVQRLHQALGFPAGCGQSDGLPAPIVTLQQSRDRRRTHHVATRVMLQREGLDAPSGRIRHRLDRLAAGWVRDGFAGTLPAPATDPQACSDPESCLVTLANSTTCNFLKQDNNGNSIEVNNTMWSTRSFANSADFYYVEQEVQYHFPLNVGIFGPGVAVENVLTSPVTVPATIQPSPSSSQCSTSYTSGVSLSIGGSAGYNQLQGFNVTPINVGMTISNSTTVTCPPMIISYSGDPAKGTTQWDYDASDSSTPYNGQTFSTTNHWIWEIGFTDYAAAQDTIQFTSAPWMDAANQPALTFTATSTAPFPFDAFALAPPTVSGVAPAHVKRGQQFKILGGGLYPSLVTDVQLGGDALPSGNWTATSDTSITVVVPSTTATGNQAVGVQTDEGQSNTNVEIKVEP